MARRSVLPAAALALTTWLTPPVFAQEVGTAPEPATAGTAQTASELQNALTSYVTALPFDKKILRVEPDPAGHRITLDPVAYLAELSGASIKFAPISIVVSERNDGSWNVFTQSPVDFSTDFELEGHKQHSEYKQDSLLFQGIYSPEIASFLSAASRIGPVTSQSSDGLSSSTAGIFATTMNIESSPAGTGLADITFNQTYDAFAQSMSVHIPDGSDEYPLAMSADMRAEEISAKVDVKAAHTRAVLDLYALLLRHFDELDADANAALRGPLGTELKTKIRAILPLWTDLQGEAHARDASIDIGYGRMQAKTLRQTMRASGVSTNASLDVDLALDGLALDIPQLPAWSAGFIPDLVELGFAVSGADLATASDILLREIQLGNDPALSPAAEEQILDALAVDRIRSQLKPSRFRSRDLELSFSGDTSFADGMPQSNMTITTPGLDKAIATLQEAAKTDPSLNQAVGALSMAKGLSKPRPNGGLEWLVVASSDGSVSVNGAMMKGPDVPPALDDEQDPGIENPAIEVPRDEPDVEEPAVEEEL